MKTTAVWKIPSLNVRHLDGSIDGEAQLTLPLRILLSPITDRFSVRTPFSGWKAVSPFGPLAPYKPLRNCRIVAAELTLFSTSPEAR
jgi:hypothetical protein